MAELLFWLAVAVVLVVLVVRIIESITGAPRYYDRER
jgi:heme exporter protein D